MKILLKYTFWLYVIESMCDFLNVEIEGWRGCFYEYIVEKGFVLVFFFIGWFFDFYF